MNAARKKVQDMALMYITKITGSTFTSELYEKQVFSKMSDEQFDVFMKDLENDKITLSVIVPTDTEGKISVENNTKIAKELGYSFFQKLSVSETEDLPGYTIPHESLVLLLPIRRVAQLLTKKISIPTDYKKIDSLTGQVTGDSKSSKLTGPELYILIGQGFDESIVELMKTRGGDEGEGNALVSMLFNTGEASQADLRNYSSGVTSGKTLETYFQAMHIKANVLER